MSMIEVACHEGKGYTRLVEYGGWTAAMLKDSFDTSPDGIAYVQKHTLTDEVFILLQGKCTLIEAGDGESPGELHGVAMEPLKYYNVKKGVWHTHILDPDTCVVVVENVETGLDNSPIVYFTPEQKKWAVSLHK